MGSTVQGGVKNDPWVPGFCNRVGSGTKPREREDGLGEKDAYVGQSALDLDTEFKLWRSECGADR